MFWGFSAAIIAMASTRLLGDGFTQPKWLCVYVITVCALCKLLFSKGELAFPRLHGLIWVPLISGTCVLLFQLIGLSPGNYEQPLLDRLCFFGLAISVYSFSRRTPLSMMALAKTISTVTVLVVGYGIFQYFSAPSPRVFSYFDYSSTFGQVNMTAQFLGISLICQIFLFQRLKHKQKIILGLLILASVFYLSASMCRSVWVALLGSIPILILKNRKFLRAWWPTTVFSICLLLFTLPFTLPVAQRILSPRVIENASEKFQNIHYRIALWEASLKMIGDHPWGIGPGNFEFGFAPYKTNAGVPLSADTAENSPHNEYLRFAVEDGIFVTVAFFSFFICLLKFPFNRNDRFLTSISIFILIEAFFQFPIINAFPFFIVAFVVGALLCKSSVVAWELSGKLKYLILAPMILCIGIYGYRFAVSYFYERVYPDNLQKVTHACQLFPNNWNACIDEAIAELHSGKPELARKTLKQMLNHSHFQFVALSVLADVDRELQLSKEECLTRFLLIRLFKKNYDSDQACEPEVYAAFENQGLYEKFLAGENLPFFSQ